MLIVATCNKCGKSGSLPITLIISEWKKYCKECKHQKQEKRELIFCDYKCCKAFLNKLISHKCENYYSAIYSIGNFQVGVCCMICRKQTEIKLPTKLKIKNVDFYAKTKISV